MSAPDAHPSRNSRIVPKAPESRGSRLQTPRDQSAWDSREATAGIWLWVLNLRAQPHQPHETAFISLFYAPSLSQVCYVLWGVWMFSFHTQVWRMPLRLCSHSEQEKPNKEYFRQSLVCIAKSHHNQQLHEEPVAVSTFSLLHTLQMSELYNVVSGQSCWLRNSTWDKGHLWEISWGKGISSTISQEMCSRLTDTYSEVERHRREGFRGGEAFDDAKTKSPLLVSS